MTSFWKLLVFGLILAILGAGMYSLQKEKSALEQKAKELNATLQRLESENKSLQAKIEHLKIPENLLKELKSQFNYREAGEKLIIVVPNVTSTNATSTKRD